MLAKKDLPTLLELPYGEKRDHPEGLTVDRSARPPGGRAGHLRLCGQRTKGRARGNTGEPPPRFTVTARHGAQNPTGASRRRGYDSSFFRAAIAAPIALRSIRAFRHFGNNSSCSSLT